MRRIYRRKFIALLGGAAAMSPLAARAQQPALPVVGILNSVDEQSAAACRQGLAEAGYIDGQNVIVDHRNTNAYELAALAGELARRKVTVIAALGGPSAPAAKSATTDIPIVFVIGGDPMELGLVSSLNRPGGNITGVTFFTAELLPKKVGLLHTLVPEAAVFGVLVNPDNPRASADVKSVRTAVSKLRREAVIASAASERDLDDAFAMMRRRNVQALVVTGDPFLRRARARLAALAVQHRIPAIYAARHFAEAGGLMTYGANVTDAYRQGGVLTGRVLKGEKVGEMPILQPTKFEMLINLKTAKAIGVTVPPTLLALADEVIE
jgi:putative ABC transport system substrate-binding protein